MNQTSYSIDQAAAFEGQVYDLAFADIISGVLEGADAAPGLFVTKGAAEKGITLPDATLEISNSLVARGFLIRTYSETEVQRDTTILTYKANQVLNVLLRGRIWVTCEDAFTETDSVFIRHAARQSRTQLGALRADNDNDTATELKGARFLNSGSARTLALLDVDLMKTLNA